MRTIVTLVSFLIYHLTIMNYANFIFDNGLNNNKKIAISAVVNAAILYLVYDYANAYTEFALCLLYFVIYSVELSFLNKRGHWTMFFGVLSFALNLFSRRVITFAVFALIFKVSIAEVYANADYRFWANLIPFILTPISIAGTKRRLSKPQLDMILSNKKNVQFAVQIMGIMYIYLVFLAFFIGTETDDTGFVVFYLLVGALAGLSYIMSMALSSLFTKLQLHVERFERLSKNVSMEMNELENLEQKSNIDSFTGLYVREVAFDTLKKFVDKKSPCHVVFIDMDGLKTVNDEYGHVEGDFYISAVANIISEAFDGDTISRAGGDEFIIVGEGSDPYSNTQKAFRAYQRVEKLSSYYEKAYQTSISYGVVTYESSDNETAEELIAIADHKMYEFKKAAKRERKSHRLQKAQ